MKKRIKIDSSILSSVILFTGVLFICKNIYPTNILFDDVFDFLGIIAVVKGILLRMTARGHKKAHSESSKSLVTTGPYQICRNPMYLGSFIMGAGFLLMVWPWWTLPLFTWAFYARFKKQVEKEEEILSKEFGEEYTSYMDKVPRLFPNIQIMMKVKTKEIFNLNEVFSTKERFGLLSWPVLAVALETFQEMLVYHQAVNLNKTVGIFLLAIAVFLIGLIISYKYR